MKSRFTSVVLVALALTACQDEPRKATGGTAQGEVLPGSVSDAMLPLDTVKSQAPLAPKVEGGDKSDAKKGDAVKASAPAEEESSVEADAPADQAEAE